MDKNIKILCKRQESILKSITFADMENLREWKNKNRGVFFYQKIINIEQQERWFSNYLKDSNNYMFLVEYNSLEIGCMGFRLISDIADIYNVILGSSQYQRKGLMSLALKMLCSYVFSFHTTAVEVKVLKSNMLGRKFYLKNKFFVIRECEKHLVMKLSANNFQTMEIITS